MSLHFLLASLIATSSALAQVRAGEVVIDNPAAIQQVSELQPPSSPKIKIKSFNFKGNTVFSNQQLEKLLTSFIGQEISFSDLSKISDIVTNYYVEQGYINSGAYISVTDNQSLKIDNAVITVGIIEGRVEAVNIVGGDRLHNYIRARIPGPILNNKRLLAALQLLQQDPLIEKISSDLKEGTTSSLSVLTIYVKPRQEFKVNINLNNYRSPAVGSFERRLELSHSNLLGLGDSLNIGYRNTDGSNAITASYSIPINPQNGTISLSYANVSNNIVEEPFTILDIASDARLYELSYRQPLLRQASATSVQEFALGLTASRLESESSLQNTPFALSAGADSRGNTRISAIRLLADYSDRSQLSSLFLRSKFSWGLDAFDSTINANSPDGRFFSWLGEAALVRRLGDTSIIARTKLQLADRPLPAFEQISLGGINTVRGYRQDAFISDNGFFFSVEGYIPAWKTPTQELQVIPFFDIGTAWNNNNSDISNTTGTLSSIGLGIQYSSDRFNARLDWGIPFNNTNSNLKTWQENGVYFSLNYQLF